MYWLNLIKISMLSLPLIILLLSPLLFGVVQLSDFLNITNLLFIKALFIVYMIKYVILFLLGNNFKRGELLKPARWYYDFELSLKKKILQQYRAHVDYQLVVSFTLLLIAFMYVYLNVINGLGFEVVRDTHNVIAEPVVDVFVSTEDLRRGVEGTEPSALIKSLLEDEEHRRLYSPAVERFLPPVEELTNVPNQEASEVQPVPQERIFIMEKVRIGWVVIETDYFNNIRSNKSAEEIVKSLVGEYAELRRACHRFDPQLI